MNYRGESTQILTSVAVHYLQISGNLAFVLFILGHAKFKTIHPHAVFITTSCCNGNACW
jgi:hypothetical protein